MKVFLRGIFISLVLSAFSLGAAHLAVGEVSFLDFLKDQNTDKPAPDFTLETLKGETANMTQFRNGNNAIIFFWATWCPHCRVALGELNKNYAEIQKKGIVVIPIDLAETKEEVAYYAKKNKIEMDIFLDKEGSLQEPYNIIGVPTFYFVGKDGIIKSVTHSLPKNIENIFSKS